MKLKNKVPFGKVSILGVTYDVYIASAEQEATLKNRSGCVDTTVKNIFINSELFKRDESTVKNLSSIIQETLTHEIIHAFIDESGLGDPYQSEVMVNWFTLMLNKIYVAANSLKIREEDYNED